MTMRAAHRREVARVHLRDHHVTFPEANALNLTAWCPEHPQPASENRSVLLPPDEFGHLIEVFRALFDDVEPRESG